MYKRIKIAPPARIISMVHAKESVVAQKKAIKADIMELAPKDRKPWHEEARPRCEGNRSSEISVRLGAAIDIPNT